MLKRLRFLKRYRKPIYIKGVSLLVFVLFLINMVFFPSLSSVVLADPVNSLTRLAGTNRYDTAIQISQATWPSADSVVLARGDDFPDALAGAVLAKSAHINGPLLLTDSNQLLPEVLTEIQRLQAKQVYILGGIGAVSANVQNTLVKNNIMVYRIEGQNRYETAANIAAQAVAGSSQAFLASGNSFADALSVSSYAAARGIPLLLTDKNTLPSVTLQALQNLGVHSVSLIGGEGVIAPSIQSQLQGLGFSVNRLAGTDRYATNTTVLNTLSFNTGKVYVATGKDFPDALSGAILAAKGNNPIILVPPSDLSSGTLAYLNTCRSEGASFTLFGGYGVISYGIEDIIRTGSVHPRISLQYLQAYGSGSTLLTNYLNQLSLLPAKASDSADILAPNLFSLDTLAAGQTAANGTFSGPWSQTDNNYSQLVYAAHSKGLKLMPIIASPWNTEGKAALDLTLTQDSSRTSLVNNIAAMVKNSGADGVVIDFEHMSASTGPYLTTFMHELYSALHAQNKIVIEAVPARTSSTDWYAAFNYHDLVQYVDYLNIMTYDYSTSTPGAIAPVAWAKSVLDYARSQGVNMGKVLLGMAYYGRDWTKTGNNTYTTQSVGLAGAMSTAADYNAPIQRVTSVGDPVGVPFYTYTDKNNAQHIVYFDDLNSWNVKLDLLDSYGLGGIGAWSLRWVTAGNAPSIFALLQEHLR